MTRETRARDRDRILAYNIAALAMKCYAGKMKSFDKEFPSEKKPLTKETVKQHKADFDALAKALAERDKLKAQEKING